MSQAEKKYCRTGLTFPDNLWEIPHYLFLICFQTEFVFNLNKFDFCKKIAMNMLRSDTDKNI